MNIATAPELLGNPLVTMPGYPLYNSPGLTLCRLPPATDADGWWTVLRSGLWRMYYTLSAEGRRRYFDELLPLLHRTKVEVMGPRDADCYYLVYLGTKPKARGRGYARKLIEDMVRVVSHPSPSSVHISPAALLLSPQILQRRSSIGRGAAVRIQYCP